MFQGPFKEGAWIVLIWNLTHAEINEALALKLAEWWVSMAWKKTPEKTVEHFFKEWCHAKTWDGTDGTVEKVTDTDHWILKVIQQS